MAPAPRSPRRGTNATTARPKPGAGWGPRRRHHRRQQPGSAASKTSQKFKGTEMEAIVPWKRKRDQPPPLPQSVSISGIRNSQVAVGTGNYTVQGSYIESAAAAAQLDQALAI